MSSARPFVHLHCHTDYSLLDGACEIEQLMDLVARQKMPSVAMTDHGNLFGAVEFYNAAKAKGIHPVIGCEVYVAQQDHKNKSEANRYNPATDSWTALPTIPAGPDYLLHADAAANGKGILRPR